MRDFVLMPIDPMRDALPSRRLVALGALASLTTACSVPRREPAVPTGKAIQASVLGLPNERFFPLIDSAPLEQEFRAAIDRRRVALRLAPGEPMPRLDLLAVSGGGENGAFGAGLLNGWTQHGDRPEFELVTGVSTGALTAPFAFLGPSYDPQLRTVYTEITPAHVLLRRSITAALFDDALTDNTPLLRTISRHLTKTMLTEIGRQYDQGRLLLIGTTDLDAQQPVMWNIGALAHSDHPKALDTVRQLLLASAAVPGAFPPTMLDVTLAGRPYQEMHVDGGAFAQAFLYPAGAVRQRRDRLRRGEPVTPAEAYIIRNARLDPEWATVQRRTMSIAGRAISTLIAASGLNDLVRMYAAAERDRMGFNLAWIGSDFNEALPSPFDPGFMRALYAYGYQRGLRGYPWAHRLPF